MQIGNAKASLFCLSRSFGRVRSVVLARYSLATNKRAAPQRAPPKITKVLYQIKDSLSPLIMPTSDGKLNSFRPAPPLRKSYTKFFILYNSLCKNKKAIIRLPPYKIGILFNFSARMGASIAKSQTFSPFLYLGAIPALSSASLARLEKCFAGNLLLFSAEGQNPRFYCIRTIAS